MLRLLRFVIGSFVIAAFASVANAADSAGEVHGSGDAYGEAGVALAWAVLRGANEAATTVVVRVVTDPGSYRWISVVGIDPFSKRQQVLVSPRRLEGSTELRSSRAAFADFPRTEFHFFASADEAQKGAARLVVYYLGVPDTTPEFPNAAALEAYLADRIARVQRGTR
jgi:hypothetical protein